MIEYNTQILLDNNEVKKYIIKKYKYNNDTEVYNLTYYKSDRRWELINQKNQKIIYLDEIEEDIFYNFCMNIIDRNKKIII